MERTFPPMQQHGMGCSVRVLHARVKFNMVLRINRINTCLAGQQAAACFRVLLCCYGLSCRPTTCTPKKHGFGFKIRRLRHGTEHGMAWHGMAWHGMAWHHLRQDSWPLRCASLHGGCGYCAYRQVLSSTGSPPHGSIHRGRVTRQRVELGLYK